MSVIVETEIWCVLRWPEKESGDIKSLIDKLFRYKNRVGLQNDGLNLTNRDRQIIKQMYESFEHDKEKSDE